MCRRKPPSNKTFHTVPRQVVALTASAQDLPPQIAHCHAIGSQRRAIHGHTISAYVVCLPDAACGSLASACTHGVGIGVPVACATGHAFRGSIPGLHVLYQRFAFVLTNADT